MARFEEQDLEIRFWEKVRVGDGCWAWTASMLGRDYGGFWKAGRMHAAQRVAWELARGPVPAGLFVLHSCTNPLCVRPSHLLLGTQTDSMRMKVARGRHRYVQAPLERRICGERQWRAKLTVDAVRRIREQAGLGRRHVDIATDFGVRRPTVSKIVRRGAWAHVS